MTLARQISAPIRSRAIEDIRGTNYFPSTALSYNNSLGFLPVTPSSIYPLPYADGFFVQSHVDEELRTLAANRINNIRLLGSFYGWLANPSGYERSLRSLCRSCSQSDISVTYVVWSAINYGGVNQFSVSPADNPYLRLQARGFPLPGPGGVNADLMRFHWDLSSLWVLAAPYQAPFPIVLPALEPTITFYADPGDSRLWTLGGFGRWPTAFRALVVRYIEWVAGFFKSDPDGSKAFISYDLFNEADSWFYSPWIRDKKDIYEFIALTYNNLLAAHPNAATTVGWTAYTRSYNAILRAQYGVRQRYHSFHSYAGPAQFFGIVTQARRDNAATFGGVPLVCSEFWDSTKRGKLTDLLAVLAHNGVPGQMWGFLQTNAYQPSRSRLPVDFDGVLQPPAAGTIRNSLRLGRFVTLNQADLRGVRAWGATIGSRHWI